MTLAPTDTPGHLALVGHHERQIMSAECKVAAADGRVPAHGTSTVMALKRAAV